MISLPRRRELSRKRPASDRVYEGWRPFGLPHAQRGRWLWCFFSTTRDALASRFLTEIADSCSNTKKPSLGHQSALTASERRRHHNEIRGEFDHYRGPDRCFAVDRCRSGAGLRSSTPD